MRSLGAPISASRVATATTRWQPGYPVDACATLSALQRGPYDPCHQVHRDGTLWRSSRMASGSVTYEIRQTDPRTVECTAWGDGAEELVAQLPELLGGTDDDSTFEPRTHLVATAHRRHRGLRIPRTTRVLEALVPAVLEQRVIGVEAFASWRRLVRRFGEPAPGPAPTGMYAPPSGGTWRTIPSWEWHRAGVDPTRARTAVRCATHERQLQESVRMSAAEAQRRLRAVSGVGVWTAAEVAQRAFGDANAVSVGDYNLAAAIGWTFRGHPVDDEEMLDILAPWSPHRGRVIALLAADGMLRKPRFGPRRARQDHRGH